MRPDGELQAGRARAGPFGQAGLGSGPASCMGSRAGRWGLPALVRAPSPRGTTERPSGPGWAATQHARVLSWGRGSRLGAPNPTPWPHTCNPLLRPPSSIL